MGAGRGPDRAAAGGPAAPSPPAAPAPVAAPGGRLRVERSGGFAGRTETAEVDLGQVDDPDLGQLVTEAVLASATSEGPPRPDMFVYTFTVDDRDPVRVPEHLLTAGQAELARRVLRPDPSTGSTSDRQADAWASRSSRATSPRSRSTRSSTPPTAACAAAAGSTARSTRPAVPRSSRTADDGFPDGLDTGAAGWTTAGAMPARWVIHVVGPNWNAGERDRSLLESCYTGALAVADELDARTVAFPLVSAGIYGWPRDDAVAVAMSTIRAAATAVEEARLVAFGRAAFDEISAALSSRPPSG